MKANVTVVAARFEDADFFTVQGGTLAGWKVVVRG